MTLEIPFWLLWALLFYGLFGYGALIIALSRLRPPRPVIEPPRPLRLTLLIAAHNEAGHIGGKLENASSLDLGSHQMEIVVVSDGSTDGTADEVRHHLGPSVRLIERTEHHGKISALNAALATISADIVIFSDANSRLRPDAVRHLVKHFGDPAVGGVCGRLVVTGRKGGFVSRAEAFYWKYEDALRTAESRLAGAVSAQGSLYAVRRELIAPIPSAVADDSIVSLRVVAQGRRLVFEPQAVTEEAVSERIPAEFGRRVRSTERGWRGLLMMSELLNPFRHGGYALQLFSHKVLRRLNPFVLALIFVMNPFLLGYGPVYVVTETAQLILYGGAFLAWRFPQIRGLRGSSLLLFFVMGNIAMGLGLCRVLVGRRSDHWIPVREAPPRERMGHPEQRGQAVD